MGRRAKAGIKPPIPHALPLRAIAATTEPH